MSVLLKWFRKRQRFVIVSYPRTGSNLLCSLLDSHPEIVCHYEIFHKKSIFLSRGSPALKAFDPGMRDASPQRFLRMIWKEDYGKKIRAIGFKIFFGHSQKILERISRDKNVLKIILYRENMLENYYSLIQAKKSGIWTNRGEIAKDKVPEEKVHIDPDDFKRYRSRHNANLREQVSLLERFRQPFMLVEYENIIHEIENIQKFLGVTPSDLIETHLEKQNIYSRISDVIDNYDEIDSLGIVKMEKKEFCAIP